jgi:hypothetical protein
VRASPNHTHQSSCGVVLENRAKGLSCPRFFGRHGCKLTVVFADENVIGSWNRLRDRLSIGNIRSSGDKFADRALTARTP